MIRAAIFTLLTSMVGISFAQDHAGSVGLAYALSPTVELNQVRMVFYRKIDAPKEGAATVYVNGDYQSSLVEGGYSELCMSTREAVDIKSRFVEATGGLEGAKSESTTLPLTAGETAFIRVEGDGDQLRTVLVPSGIAHQELPSVRQQNHTFSRVVGSQACHPRETKGKPYVITLSDGVLFDFGKATLSPQGRQVLDAVAGAVNNKMKSISQFEAIGHTDPIGNPKQNLILSKDRAETVRSYLTYRSVNARIRIDGKGSSNPLVSCSTKMPMEKQVTCNAPNRRVEIIFVGDAKPENL